MDKSIKTSGNFSVEEWPKLRNKLLFSDEYWSEAIKVFEDRIQLRFLAPIEKIKSINENKGEGFSIALISVVLLEFLAAFELGKIYRYNKEELSPSEYCNGKKLLKVFLKNSKVFGHHFSSDKIDDFYKNIRCGLVHEARTLKDDIIISKNSIKNTKPDAIYFKEDKKYRLNRDLLLEKIKEHIEGYKKRLIDGDSQLRENFILKMDEIHGLKHAWYFMYGSNMDDTQLNSRLREFNDKYLLKQRCSLKGYQFKYNKRSNIDGSSKGNLIEKTDFLVQGVAILILESTLDVFIALKEKGYEKIEFIVDSENYETKDNQLHFKAFSCISKDLTTASPNKDYEERVVKGARENGLPEDYIASNLVFDFK